MINFLKKLFKKKYIFRTVIRLENLDNFPVLMTIDKKYVIKTEWKKSDDYSDIEIQNEIKENIYANL